MEKHLQIIKNSSSNILKMILTNKIIKVLEQVLTRINIKKIPTMMSIMEKSITIKKCQMIKLTINIKMICINKQKVLIRRILSKVNTRVLLIEKYYIINQHKKTLLNKNKVLGCQPHQLSSNLRAGAMKKIKLIIKETQESKKMNGKISMRKITLKTIMIIEKSNMRMMITMIKIQLKRHL